MREVYRDSLLSRANLRVSASDDQQHRRRLRAVLSEAGIEGVTPQAFRRTVATVLDRASGPDLAAEVLGHTSFEITTEHYIQPDEAVDPVTAEILESLTPK